MTMQGSDTPTKDREAPAFTQGPWVSEGDLIETADGHWVAEAASHHENYQANARLIAAAPELFAALSKLRLTAAVLYQNAEGCAIKHHGADFVRDGIPGWLVDAKRDIEDAFAALSKALGKETPHAE